MLIARPRSSIIFPSLGQCGNAKRGSRFRTARSNAWARPALGAVQQGPAVRDGSGSFLTDSEKVAGGFMSNWRRTGAAPRSVAFGRTLVIQIPKLGARIMRYERTCGL